MASEGFFECKNSKVHFVKFGEGQKLMIALHGFADRSAVFLALEPALKNKYTVYAITLPFHDPTIWEKDFFDQEDMVEIIEIVLKREGKKRFEMMGYSFGGRIILATLSRFIQRLDKVFLIAPDGIKTNGMPIASLAPLWLRRVLQKQAEHPGFLIKLLFGVYKIGLVSKFNFHFVKHNLTSKERRDRIFKTWISLKNFEVDLKKVKALLEKQPVPVALYFGKYDKVIPLKVGEKLNEIIPNAQLNIIDEGHLLINEKLNELLNRQMTRS